jgi:hypothetical protein
VELLTNSRAKCFRDCTQRHHYEYELGYRPAAVAHPLWFGDCIHHGLQPYWEVRRDGGDALGAALAALPDDADPFELVKMRAMLTAYAVVWDRVDLEVLAVEAEFRLPLIHPLSGAASREWELAGKIDLVVRFPDGRVAVVEHKTSSQDVGPGSDYRRRLTLDTQVSQDLMGAEALGFAPDLIVYDVLRKPQLKPLLATPVEQRKYTKPTKAEPTPRLYATQREFDETVDEYAARLGADFTADPNKYIERVELHRFDDERARFAVDVWKLSQSISLTRSLSLEAPNPGACFAHHSACPFLPVCERTASLDDEALYRRVEFPHEELTRAA